MDIRKDKEKAEIQIKLKLRNIHRILNYKDL